MDSNDLFEPGQQILLFPSCSAQSTQHCSLWSLTKQQDTHLYSGRAVQVHESTHSCAEFHTSVFLKHSMTFQARCSYSSLLVTFTRSLCSRRNLAESELWRSNVSSDFSKCCEEISSLIKLRGDEGSLLQLCRLTKTCHLSCMRMHRPQWPTRSRYTFAILYGLVFKANWSVTHFHGWLPVVYFCNKKKWIPTEKKKKKSQQVLNCRDKWMEKSLLIS